MSTYYNEWEPYPAQWLRNLIAAGHLPSGDVDERDIKEVNGDDLEGYDQCHFFAGIGGWPLALHFAGWSDDEPVWTGSCPCQPLSGAGQRKGHADERHLWPAFQSLIAQRRPATVFGEQVASGLGREWLAGVRTDLEHLGYAVGAADLPAAGVGAPHIRQRLWWVADAGKQRRQQVPRSTPCHEAPNGRERRKQREQNGNNQPTSHGQDRGPGGLADTNGARSQSRKQATETVGYRGAAEPTGGATGGVDDAAGARRKAHGRSGQPKSGAANDITGTGQNYWSAFDLALCINGKARRVEPGTFPLAHGVPARLGKLRAYGNAIVPQVAAEFVKAAMECRP